MSRYGGRGPGTTLYVRNLSERARYDDVRHIFGKYGRILDITIPLDYYTGQPKGFCFIEYEDPRDADEAQYRLHRQRIFNREVEIEFARGVRKTPGEMRTRDNRSRGYDDRYDSRRRDERPYGGDYRRRSRSRTRSRSGGRGHSPRSPRDRSPGDRRRSRTRSYSGERGGGGGSPSPRRNQSPRERSRSPVHNNRSLSRERNGRSRSRSGSPE